MPRVPDARVRFDTGPQIRTDALQGGFAREVDVSRPMRQVAEAANSIATGFDRIAQRDAEAEANRAEDEITRGWLEWDAQARQRFRGANAAEYETEAAKWWDETAGNYGKAMSPMARARVSQALMRKRTSAMASGLQFVNSEKERHADETAAANVSTTIQFGVTSGDVAWAAGRIRQIAADQGARKGWTTEQVQAEQQRHLSALHLAQISRLASTNAVEAKNYYEANRAEVGFQHQQRVEEVIKGEINNQKASRFAASVATKPFAERLQEASKIEDPDLREKALQKIREVEGLNKVARAEREKAAADQAWQMVGQGQRVPEAVLSQMDGRERVQLQDYLKQRAKAAAEGGNKPVKTDPVVKAELYDLVTRDPEAFKNVRLAAYAMKVSTEDLEQLQKLQATMVNPKAKTSGDPIKFMNKLSAKLPEALAGTKGDTRKVLEGSFKDQAFKEYEAALARSGGKPLSPEEEDAILDRLLMPGSVERDWWFDKDARFFQVPPDQRERFIPKDGRTPAPTGPVRVRSVEEARALKPGTRFIDPNGVERIR